MKSLFSRTSESDHRADGASRQVSRVRLRVLLAAAIAAAVLGFGMLHGPPKPARAGEQDAANQKPPASGHASHQDIVARFERTLAGIDRRLIVLAKLLLEDAAVVKRDQGPARAVALMIETKGAESAYLNAKLTREVAEIALMEYKSGTAVQERQTAEGEIALATSGVERARRNTAEARERLARITALTDNSAFGLNLDYLYTDRLTSTELMEKQATLTLETAESKKKVLIQYTILKRMKELESEVKKAHSDELARQATWELCKGKEEAARRESKRINLPEDRKRILALLDEAIPLEDKIRAQLSELSKSDESSEKKAEEIGRLIHDLEALVDRAESLRDAGDFARLKSRIQQTARKYGATTSK